MKRLVLMIALFAQILPAQQNSLTVDLQAVTGSSVNWETTISLDAQNGMENGVLIEIPAGLKMAPLNARINEAEMFLQNINETPSKESVVCWDLSAEGIILFFRDGQFNSGDQIVIKTMTTQIKKRIAENPTITIRTVQKNNQDIQISEDIKASSIVKLKIEN